MFLSQVSSVIFQQIKFFTEGSDDRQHRGCNIHQKLLDICQARADFCLSDIHFAVNILDPGFCGEQLTEDQDVKGMQFNAKTVSKSDFTSPTANFAIKCLNSLACSRR